MALVFPFGCSQSANAPHGANAGKPGEVAQIDPICKMSVYPSSAKASFEHEGKTYYFCSPHCKEEFEKAPEKYINTPQEQS